MVDSKRDNKVIYLGLHIHKTAGTTLLEHFRKHTTYGEYQDTRAFFNYQNGICHFDELPFRARKNMSLIWGHAVHESMVYGLNKQIFLFAFLRKPIDRIISWYKFERDTIGTTRDFEDFVMSRSNSMCQNLIRKFPSLISPKAQDLSSKAISVLTRFNFIGCQEDFSEHSKVLLQKLSLPPIEEGVRHNTSRSEDVFPRDLVAQNNQEDIKLYEHFFAGGSQNYHFQELSLTNLSFESKRRHSPPKQIVKNLIGELNTLKNHVKLEERRVNDTDVVFRRLCSLYFTAKPKDQQKILILLKDYCGVANIDFNVNFLESKPL